MNDSIDPLEPLLRPVMVRRSELEDVLRQRTSRLVRGRRVRVRAVRLLLGAACLLLALVALGWSWRQFVAERRNHVEAGPLVAQGAGKEGPVEEPAASTPSASTAGPARLEWQAFDATESRAASYLQAGDLYLEEQQDYAAALRCYRQVFEESRVADIARDDNWLVMALKLDRGKEK